jgi:molybdopterin/thiamine biosynthesis adenylyltransferase
MSTVRIRFEQGAFAALRDQLLIDTRQEAFALLFGQYHQAGDRTVIKIVAVHRPTASDYASQGPAHLRLHRDYVYERLVEMQRRGDVDTVIDVHTHPFAERAVSFSGVDDRDEIAFHRWLTATLDNVHYGSIVLSRSDYAARLWRHEADSAVPRPSPARLYTQTVLESWPSAEDPPLADGDRAALDPQSGFLARSALALGLDTLRRIVQDQRIAVVGVGGLGSVIAENLVHSGFHQLDLIDHDVVEVTNLNRIVGAYASDAAAGRLKVEVVKGHLERINPAARVGAYPWPCEDERLLPVLAAADWIILATDSHASRFHTQAIALRYGIPLISAGVNISVTDGRITDMSGEVIVVRAGDRLCLNCLGRIAPTRIAAETVAGLGAELAHRGYVTGQEVKEPAVKTLNAMLGALAVDSLLNQYTGRQPHTPVLIYENNALPCLYPDRETVARRPKDCFHCG